MIQTQFCARRAVATTNDDLTQKTDGQDDSNGRLGKRLGKLAERLANFPQIARDVEGRVLPPLILYFLGVPGFFCVLIWLFFFRGK